MNIKNLFNSRLKRFIPHLAAGLLILLMGSFIGSCREKNNATDEGVELIYERLRESEITRIGLAALNASLHKQLDSLQHERILISDSIASLDSIASQRLHVIDELRREFLNHQHEHPDSLAADLNRILAMLRARTN